MVALYIIGTLSFLYGWHSSCSAFIPIKLLIDFVTISWDGICQIIHIHLTGFQSIAIADFAGERLCRTARGIGSHIKRW